MTRHPEPPKWTYWVPPAALMATLALITIGAVYDRHWMTVATGIVGIIASAGTWKVILTLRERVMIQKRLAATQDYRIAGLEQQLKRERAWRN